MREDAGSVTVSVSVMSGTISRDTIVTVSTAPGGTATGGIIVLRSTAASIPKETLPYFLNQTPWLLSFAVCFGITFDQTNTVST